MPRSAEAERPKILQKVRAYLAQAAADGALGLTHDDIAAGARVAKRHLSRMDHPEFMELAQEIVAAQRARKPQAPQIVAEGSRAAEAGAKDSAGSAPLGAPVEGFGGLDRRELEVRIERAGAEVRRLMQVYLGHHRAGEAVTDAPLLLHDLEKAMLGLKIQADRIRPLVAEVQRRERLAVFRPSGTLSVLGDRQAGLFDSE